MRIAYLFSDDKHAVFRSTGDSVHIQEVCGALRALGHEVFIVAAERGREGDALVQVPVFEVGRPAAPRRGARLESAGATNARGGYAPEAAAAPAWALRPTARDAARLGWAAVWNAWFAARARAILARETPDVLYERYVPFGRAGMRVASRLDLPYLVEMNTSFSFSTEAWHRRSPLYGLATNRTERQLASRADRALAVSSAVRDHLVALGVPAAGVAVLPNAVDPDIFRPDREARAAARQDLGLGREDVAVGFLGSLKRWHGVDLLVDAALTLRERLPSLAFFVAGDGPLRPTIAERAAREGLGRFVVAGTVPRHQAAAWLNAIDIAVAPAPQLETFYFSPLKLFEYMATGTAVVAARFPEIEAVVTDGETGLLVPPGDPAALAGAIERLAGDRELRAALGRRAREVIVERHTWKHRAARITEIFEEAQRARQARSRAR